MLSRRGLPHSHGVSRRFVRSAVDTKALICDILPKGLKMAMALAGNPSAIQGMFACDARRIAVKFISIPCLHAFMTGFARLRPAGPKRNAR